MPDARPGETVDLRDPEGFPTLAVSLISLRRAGELFWIRRPKRGGSVALWRSSMGSQTACLRGDTRDQQFSPLERSIFPSLFHVAVVRQGLVDVEVTRDASSNQSKPHSRISS